MKFAIRFSNNLAKDLRKATQFQEEKVKHFESSVTNYYNDLQYIEYRKVKYYLFKKGKWDTDKK